LKAEKFLSSGDNRWNFVAVRRLFINNVQHLGAVRRWRHAKNGLLRPPPPSIKNFLLYGIVTQHQTILPLKIWRHLWTIPYGSVFQTMHRDTLVLREFFLKNTTNRTLCAILVMVYHQGVPWLKKVWKTLAYGIGGIFVIELQDNLKFYDFNGRRNN